MKGDEVDSEKMKVFFECGGVPAREKDRAERLLLVKGLEGSKGGSGGQGVGGFD